MMNNQTDQLNKTQHTPGPWRDAHTFFHPQLRDKVTDIHPLGRLLQSDARPQDEAEANARLIAAAPALLDVCQKMLASLDGDGISAIGGCDPLNANQDWKLDLDDVRAVIAAATQQPCSTPVINSNAEPA